MKITIGTLRAVFQTVMTEAKASLVRVQAAKGDINPAAKVLIQKFAAQLSRAVERKEDPAWVKNTQALIMPLAQHISNQAVTLAWAATIANVPDDQDVQIPDEDVDFQQKVMQRVQNLLTDMVKSATSGQIVSEQDIETMALRIVANVKKTFIVSPTKNPQAQQSASNPNMNAAQ